VSVRLDSEQHEPHNESHDERKQRSASMVELSLPRLDALPPLPFPLTEFLRRSRGDDGMGLGLEQLLMVLRAMLLDCPVLLHSSRLDSLSVVGETLKALLFPFKWDFPYIPICPKYLWTDVVQSPSPFLIGVRTKWIGQQGQGQGDGGGDPELPGTVYVVDIDRGVLTGGDEQNWRWPSDRSGSGALDDEDEGEDEEMGFPGAHLSSSSSSSPSSAVYEELCEAYAECHRLHGLVTGKPVVANTCDVADTPSSTESRSQREGADDPHQEGEETSATSATGIGGWLQGWRTSKEKQHPAKGRDDDDEDEAREQAHSAADKKAGPRAGSRARSKSLSPRAESRSLLHVNTSTIAHDGLDLAELSPRTLAELSMDGKLKAEEHKSTNPSLTPSPSPLEERRRDEQEEVMDTDSEREDEDDERPPEPAAYASAAEIEAAVELAEVRFRLWLMAMYAQLLGGYEEYLFLIQSRPIFNEQGFLDMAQQTVVNVEAAAAAVAEAAAEANPGKRRRHQSDDVTDATAAEVEAAEVRVQLQRERRQFLAEMVHTRAFFSFLESQGEGAPHVSIFNSLYTRVAATIGDGSPWGSMGSVSDVDADGVANATTALTTARHRQRKRQKLRQRLRHEVEAELVQALSSTRTTNNISPTSNETTLEESAKQAVQQGVPKAKCTPDYIFEMPEAMMVRGGAWPQSAHHQWPPSWPPLLQGQGNRQDGTSSDRRVEGEGGGVGPKEEEDGGDAMEKGEGAKTGVRPAGKGRFSLLSPFKWSSSKDRDLAKGGGSKEEQEEQEQEKEEEGEEEQEQEEQEEQEEEQEEEHSNGSNGEQMEGSGTASAAVAEGAAAEGAAAEGVMEVDGTLWSHPLYSHPPVLPIAWSVFPQLQLTDGDHAADKKDGAAQGAAQGAAFEVWTYERVAAIVGADAKQLLWAKNAPWLTVGQMASADDNLQAIQVTDPASAEWQGVQGMQGMQGGMPHQMGQAQKQQRKLSLFSNQQLASHEMLESLLLSTLEKVLCSSFIAEEELRSCEAAFEHQHFRCFFVLLITRPWSELYRRRLQRKRKSRPPRSLSSSSTPPVVTHPTVDKRTRGERGSDDGMGIGMAGDGNVNVSAAHVQFSKARLDSSGTLCTPLMHSSHALLSCTPLIHSSPLIRPRAARAARECAAAKLLQPACEGGPSAGGGGARRHGRHQASGEGAGDGGDRRGA
jgi:hypothetical protein